MASQSFDVELTAVAHVSVTISVKAASQEAANAIVQTRIENDNDDFSELEWGIDQLAEVEISESPTDEEDDDDCDDDSEDDDGDDEDEEDEDSD